MSSWKIAAIFAAILAVAGLIVLIAVIATPKGDDTDARERVRLEIRCNRAAAIKLDGKSIGMTPLGIYVPKRSNAVQIDATIVLHLMAPRGHQSVEQERTMTKTIVPDHDQLVDFVSPLQPERIPDDER